MTYSRGSAGLSKLVDRAIRSSRFIAFAIVLSFTSLAIQPAHAQSSDTWKSVAIIGGSTAVGAYVGHKVGGTTGAWVGAAAGASTGYAIDQRRRANEYNNQAYNDGGYYGNGPYSPDSGYYGGPGDGGAYPYPAGYRSNNYSRSSNRFVRQR